MRAGDSERRPMTVVPLSPTQPSTSPPVALTESTDDDPVDAAITARHKVTAEGKQFWVEGNALLCSCPNCQAPITVRIWLGLADCWRCQSSVALSDEQMRLANELMRETVTPTRSVPPPPVPRSRPQPAAPPAIEQAAAVAIDPRQQELERLTEMSAIARWVQRGFAITPAWFVSFLLHLIALLILALIVLGVDGPVKEAITLSTSLDHNKREGADIRLENPLDRLQYDLPLANQLDVDEEELRKVLQQAEQDAMELQVDHQPTAPLANIDDVRKNITTRQGPLMSFAARDPRVRSEIVRKEGGTTLTEAAVARGLKWLASVQNQDGSWSLKDYDDHDDPDNTGDAMATSLALLPFLGAGQTHEYGRYKQNVAKGLAWLIDRQKADGDLRAGYTRNAGMYAHGQGAIVLCEALAMTGDEQLREPARKAIRFTERAQHSEGGWRYRPGQRGDTSVYGWHLMALQSARAPNLGLDVDKSTMKLADYFLDKVSTTPPRRLRMPKGSIYTYQPGGDGTPVMTAEAILCRIYLGWKRDDPRLMAAVSWLVNDHLPTTDEMNIYYWYYGTQVMHHYGGQAWEVWNDRMREILVGTQRTRGRHPGSWEPRNFRWGEQGGRIYTTALAVCTLEVYYRHLPIFQPIELDD